MSAYDELAAAVAVHGPFPMPTGDTGSVAMKPEQRAAIAVQIGDVQPATDALIGTFAESVANVRNHEHPSWEDLYCMNLTSYMGERMAPVLKRLLDAETESARLRARVAELETALADATEPDVDGAGRTYQEYQPGRRDPRPGAEAARRMIRDRQTAEDAHDGPLHHTYALGRDLPATHTYRSSPLPPGEALCATCGHNGAAHHHAGTACWADLPKRLGESIRLCKCSAFAEVTR